MMRTAGSVGAACVWASLPRPIKLHTLARFGAPTFSNALRNSLKVRENRGSTHSTHTHTRVCRACMHARVCALFSHLLQISDDMLARLTLLRRLSTTASSHNMLKVCALNTAARL